MMCYRDRTFCPFSNTCSDSKKGCYRALTKEDEKSAERQGLPISLFTEKPTCYKENKGDE